MPAVTQPSLMKLVVASALFVGANRIDWIVDNLAPASGGVARPGQDGPIFVVPGLRPPIGKVTSPDFTNV